MSKYTGDFQRYIKQGTKLGHGGGPPLWILWPAKVFLKRGHLREDVIMGITIRRTGRASRQREQQRSTLCFKVRRKVSTAGRD